MEDIYENSEAVYYNEEQPTVKETANVGESYWQVYTLPSRGVQENQNEYQELQIRPTIVHTNQNRNSSVAGATSHKEQKARSEECHEIKDNIKKLRRCICTLSLLFALLLLITIIIAVLGLNNNLNVRGANDPSAQQGAAGITEELRLNDTLSTINDNLNMLMTQLTVINQTLSLSMELTQNQLEIVRNKTGSLEAHFNESNEIISTDVDSLEARINNLQTMSQSQLATVDNSLRSMIADLETRLQSASYQNITSLRAMITNLQSSQLTTDTEISALQANQLVQPGIHIVAMCISCIYIYI